MIRDYVITVLSWGITSLKGDEFKNTISKIMVNPVGLSALMWYLQYANNDHKKIMLEEYSIRALRFLEEYDTYINKFTPNLKEYLEPRTTNNIGLVISNPEISVMVSYGFRPLENSRDEKLVVVNPRVGKEWYKSFLQVGVKSFKGRSNDFLAIDP